MSEPKIFDDNFFYFEPGTKPGTIPGSTSDFRKSKVIFSILIIGNSTTEDIVKIANLIGNKI